MLTFMEHMRSLLSLVVLMLIIRQFSLYYFVDHCLSLLVSFVLVLLTTVLSAFFLFTASGNLLLYF